ncbi:hypothetical protein [Roseiconus lacunae]|uniref:Uncharacterized protein n=1 Tax=Roseiconus lacunae TaxID=2605694 RepID=A0ABT7PK57_9BACT|nr:hypothetical protein [Roseiconus lacunae]MDM4016684.1 hypothetical protein [Roseiconus lacunae]
MLGDKSPIRISFERQRIAKDIFARERDCNRLVQACASKNPCGLSDLIEAATESISAGRYRDDAARVLSLVAQCPPELIAEVEVDAMTNSSLASVSSEAPPASILVALQAFVPQKPFDVADGVYPFLPKVEAPEIICEVLHTLYCCGPIATLESLSVVEPRLHSADEKVFAEGKRSISPC